MGCTPEIAPIMCFRRLSWLMCNFLPVRVLSDHRREMGRSAILPAPHSLSHRITGMHLYLQEQILPHRIMEPGSETLTSINGALLDTFRSSVPKDGFLT